MDATSAPDDDAFAPPGVDAATPPRADASSASGWRATPRCIEHADCDDGLACTEDTCRRDFFWPCPPGVACYLCQHTPRATLCGPAETCDDRSGCVTGTACARDADCADDDPCTMNERCDPSSRVCLWSVLDGDNDGEAPPICGGADCNDANRSARPGGPEHCNGADDDCDGRVDEGAAETCGIGFTCATDGICRCTDASARVCDAFEADFTYRVCADTDSDDEYCGDCYTSCDPGSRCVSGRCACDDPILTSCSGTCIDTSSDPLHCGSCIRRCGTGQLCVASTCQSCGGSGEPCCAGSTCDTATLACDGSTCAPRACALPYDPLPASYLPRCTSSTLTCMRGCTTGACRNSCLDADGTPEHMGVNCNECVNFQYLACLDDAGCGDEWAAYECCYEDNCLGMPTCTACASQRSTWQTCASRAACYVDAGFTLQCYAAP